ncbi:MAG: hypothetical protein RL088_184 [Verrucomicrobiota bacterium]|jgi:hypothetical protein
MHWNPSPNHDPYSPPPEGRFQRFCYWLAGARAETLQHCPATERERIAVLGSTVLIPTVMGFLGMIFYTKSRFHEPPWFSIILISLAWAAVILNVDRILLATYRPFQPWWRRFMQVVFRFLLAGVVSVAISFPFCLDQYRPAIVHRYQTELQGKLNGMRNEEAAGRKALRDRLEEIRAKGEVDRKQLLADFKTRHDALTAQLPELQKVIVNPEAYADTRMEEERKKAGEPDFVAPASGATRNILAQIDAQKETLAKTKSELDAKLDLHRRLVEAIAREALGQPNEFYPEVKKPGEGPRLKDMQARDRATVADANRLESASVAQQAALAASDRQLADARLADKNAYLDALAAKRDAFVEEGKEKERIRKERLAKVEADIVTLEAEHASRIEKLTQHIAALEADHASAQKRHDETHLPPIARMEQKINGVFDPMEETIGLYKVIFELPPDATEEEKRNSGHKWMAGAFQFLVIFGTLFVLDLVPIMAKIFSRPGPYDVLVEHPEFIANENLATYKEAYSRQHGGQWEDDETPADKKLLQSRKLTLPVNDRQT